MLPAIHSKIHIDIGQYEFVEFEKEGEFTPDEIMKLWEKYHKLTQKKEEGRSVKKQKHELDFVQDLPESDEPIVVD